MKLFRRTMACVLSAAMAVSMASSFAASAASAVAELDSVDLFNGVAEINGTKVNVEILKNSDKKLNLKAKDNGKAVVSEDGTKIIVTSEDGQATKEYELNYSEFNSYDTTGTGNPEENKPIHNKGITGYYDVETKEFTQDDSGDVRQYNDEDINTAGELNWGVNYTNLDPNGSYVLTAKVAFDLTDVAASTKDDALVIGLGPCVYDVDDEIGWAIDGKPKGSWSAGVYNYYVTGGIYTYGQVKALQAEADKGDGYVRLQTVINSDTFKFDPSEMTSLRIQERLAGQGNINGLSKEFTPDDVRTPNAPEGIKAVFAGYELSMQSNTAVLDTVKVNGTAAAIDETAKTVKIELPAGTDVNKAVVEATAKDGAKATVSADRKTVTVVSESGRTTVTYALTISAAKTPDPKPGDNNNVNKPADNKKPAASKKASVKKITIKQGKKTVKTIKIKLKKKTIRLKAVVTGKNLTKAYKKISWTTSKKKIATVSSKGVVKLKKKGTVKITAKNKKSGKKATVKIIIKK